MTAPILTLIGTLALVDKPTAGMDISTATIIAAIAASVVGEVARQIVKGIPWKKLMRRGKPRKLCFDWRVRIEVDNGEKH